MSGTNAGSDCGLRMCMSLIDRRVLLDSSMHTMTEAGCRSRDSCRATIPLEGDVWYRSVISIICALAYMVVKAARVFVVDWDVNVKS